MNETFHAIAAKYKDEIVQTASELIQINSQSLHEKELAEYVAAKMRKLGYDDVTVDAYGSVFGTVKGTGGGSSVMLNCHMDVVDAGDPARWKHPPYSGEIAEGRIWGRGASDTKGTFAIQLYVPVMLRELGMLPKGDIVVAGVVAEEIAGFGAMMHTKENRDADGLCHRGRSHGKRHQHWQPRPLLSLYHHHGKVLSRIAAACGAQPLRLSQKTPAGAGYGADGQR